MTHMQIELPNYMNNNFLFSADYGMGIGDFLVKLYAISHLNLYIKQNIPNTRTIFIIEEYNTRILSSILNLNFFINFFDEFYIQNIDGQYLSGLGKNTINYKGKKYTKSYSAINDVHNNQKGYWETYAADGDDVSNIAYSNFDYRDPSTRKSEPIPDFNLPLFLDKFFIFARDFRSNAFGSSVFECVYYKCIGGELDLKHLNDFIEKMKKNFAGNMNKVFLTSNSEKAKNIIKTHIPNSITYKSINIHAPDGYGTACSDESRIYDLITEMIIMSYAELIHYCGNYSYISLFNYYPHMVKRIPLINYII